MTTTSPGAFPDQTLADLVGKALLANEAQSAPWDSQRERLVRWAESEDPVKCVSEMFGYRLEPEQQRIIYELEGQNQRISDNPELADLWDPPLLGHSGLFMLLGGNGTMKTSTVAMWALGWRWSALASLPENENSDEPLGCYILIPAPTDSQVKDTVYAQNFHPLAARAQRRGIEIPGYKDNPPRYRGASESRIHWQVPGYSGHWLMRALVPRVVSAVHEDTVQHSVAGRHHPNLVVFIEEAMHVQASVIRQMTGGTAISPQNRVVACLNPTAGTGHLYQESRGSGWREIELSVLKHTNVIYREERIPGACSHLQVERALKSPGMATCRGPLSEKIQPDPIKKEFVYAPPPEGAEEMPGPREDGIPGHPLGTPMVYTPSSTFCGQILGCWPPGTEGGTYDMMAVIECMRAWTKIRPPDDTPKVVGVDAAGTGPDPVVATPRWGPSAHQALLNARANMSQERIYIGEQRSIPKATGAEMAAELEALYGTSAIYIVDTGGQGLRIIEGLQARGLHAVRIEFGGAPTSEYPAPGLPRGKYQRDHMIIEAAACCAEQLVALPPDQTGRLQGELRAISGEEVRTGSKYAGDRTPGAVTIKHLPKTILAKKAGYNSLDYSDSFHLALAEPPRGLTQAVFARPPGF